MRKAVLGACLGLFVAAGSAHAGAIISDGNVMLGVDDFGQLNVRNGTGGVFVPTSPSGTTEVGLRFVPFNNESTSPGCLCEGWGVGIATAGGAAIASGSSNNAFGTFGLTPFSFASTASTATSVVDLTAGGLRVTHDFSLAAGTLDLYRVRVTIENTGADIAKLLYRRVMDWDVDPTTFDEYSTIFTGGASAVTFTSDNGFASADPFAGPSSLLAIGEFVDSGPADHGALFDFDFGALAAGDSFTFDIFYGGSFTELGAFAALAAVGAEVYSFGQASNDPLGLGIPLPSGAPTNTFIFGFSGVGGTPVAPIPEPTTLALFGLGALGLAGLARRRRRAAQIKTEA